MKRAALFLQGGRLTFVALKGRGEVDHFQIEAAENLGAALKAEIDARRLKLRGARLGLPRTVATVKVLDLPPTVGADLPQMVRFELDRHLPFPAEDVVSDFVQFLASPDTERRILIVACERRVVDQSLRVLEESKVRPLSLTVACHDLRHLLGRQLPARRAVWIHRHGGMSELLFLGGGQIHLSRTLPGDDPDELAAEIGATFGLLRWRDCDGLWISGDGADGFLGSPAMEALGAAVTDPPYTSMSGALVQSLPLEEPGAHLLALGSALAPRRPSLNLLPEELRPRTWTPAQILTAAMATGTAVLALAVLVAQGHQEQRHLDRLSTAIRGLDPEIRDVERLAAEVGQRKRLLGAVRAADSAGIRPLPFLRELTETLPADAWISALNLDVRGVELTGQANAASQLIPLLENSPWLERVEFTSPVTRGRDKEQFRIKAAWEPGAAQRVTPASPPTPPTATPPPSGPPLPPAFRSRPPASGRPGAPVTPTPERPRSPRRTPPTEDDDEG
jgi:Tfp pilus assembly protein PilN